VAHAQPSADKPSVAARLFREGKALLQAEQVDAACDKLAESRHLEATVGTLGLLAYCRELQGRTATAWLRYLEAAALAQLAGDRTRAQVARERAQVLERSLSRVHVVVEHPVQGLAVTLGGRELPAARWGEDVPLDAGSFEVRASAPGYRSWNVRLDLAGDAARLTIRVPGLESAQRRRGQPPPTQPHSSPNLVPGLTLGGAGVLLLGVGAYFGLRAVSKNDDSKAHCIDNACAPEGGTLRDDAKSAALVSTVSVSLGLIGVGIGAVMVFQAAHEQGAREQGAHLRISPFGDKQHAGVAMRGVF
jgi:hypothetical protein